MLTRPVRSRQPISDPFDFTIISQANPADALRLRLDGIPPDMAHEWNRALHRESQSRPSTARTFASSHFRADSVATIETVRSRPRSRANSVQSVLSADTAAAADANNHQPASPKEPAAQVRHACPITPPLRSSSRHCLRIPEHPDEELTDHQQRQRGHWHAVTTPGDICCGQLSPGVEKIFPPESESEPEPEPEPEPGPEPAAAAAAAAAAAVPDTRQAEPGSEPAGLPTIRETQSTPELAEPADEQPGYKHQLFLSVRSRPLSQLSQLSDTLNGSFVVPPSSPVVRRGSVRSRRVSRNRLSALIKLQGGGGGGGGSSGHALETATIIDSWEEDIDWCYEHEAEADCDFDWDRSSTKTSSDRDEPTATVQTAQTAPPPAPPPPSTAPTAPPPSPTPPPVLDSSVFDFGETKSELLGIPEEPAREEPVQQEKRITGIFEDRLLLPPSPRFAPSSFGFASPSAAAAATAAAAAGGGGLGGEYYRRGVRDGSDFDGDMHDDRPAALLVRTGSLGLRHRSISSSASLPELVPGRSYREELCRVARQLDEHIAALNSDCCYAPQAPAAPAAPATPAAQVPALHFTVPAVPARRTSLATEAVVTTRARADSQATCVTLCSDTETVTPTETHEVVTPSGSAHNSFQFTRKRASSVSGAGFAVEGRLDKGLSFPAAAIPGVVELAPDDELLAAGETEFVHFI